MRWPRAVFDARRNELGAILQKGMRLCRFATHDDALHADGERRVIPALRLAPWGLDETVTLQKAAADIRKST